MSSGYEIRPVVEAILAHPDLYEGPSLVKAPMVGDRRDASSPRPGRHHRLLDMDLRHGRTAALPPAERLRVGRAAMARHLQLPRPLVLGRRDHRQGPAEPGRVPRNETPQEAVDKALKYWGYPSISQTTRDELIAFGEGVEGLIEDDWQRGTFRALRQNALRALVATSPDQQAS